ncbi:cAMP-responsive element modulator [Collichthys lucidus]|uniref:cAMP-responsive element modulator n=1 Tax=Collichthys lucidus TaxID=240159 RepID=A0A4U5UX06_COLLU|nr:cAMP-responsive element modulator [Collichthys lucidus]
MNTYLTRVAAPAAIVCDRAAKLTGDHSDSEREREKETKKKKKKKERHSSTTQRRKRSCHRRHPRLPAAFAQLGPGPEHRDGGVAGQHAEPVVAARGRDHPQEGEYLKLPKEAVKQRVNKPPNHRISVVVETVFGIGFDTFLVFLMRQVTSSVQREAARECRRKKKEYVKCLENRVAVLENQNKTLIEELKALKDIYCHKAE